MPAANPKILASQLECQLEEPTGMSSSKNMEPPYRKRAATKAMSALIDMGRCLECVHTRVPLVKSSRKERCGARLGVEVREGSSGGETYQKTENIKKEKKPKSSPAIPQCAPGRAMRKTMKPPATLSQRYVRQNTCRHKPILDWLVCPWVDAAESGTGKNGIASRVSSAPCGPASEAGSPAATAPQGC